MMLLQKLLKLMMILEWCFWINCSNWYMILDRWWEWCFCKDSETQLRRQVMSTVLETQVRFGRFIYFRNWINNFLSTCRRPFYPRTSWRMWRRTCKYSVQFDQKDRLRLRRASKELVEKRKAAMAEFEVFKRLHNTMMSWVWGTLQSVDSRYDKPFFMSRLMHQPTVNLESVDASTDSSSRVGWCINRLQFASTDSWTGVGWCINRLSIYSRLMHQPTHEKWIIIPTVHWLMTEYRFFLK